MINFIRTSTKGNILGLLLITIAGVLAGCTAQAETNLPAQTQAQPPQTQTQSSSVQQSEVATTSPDFRRNGNPYSETPYDADLDYSMPSPRKTSALITKAGFQKIKVGMTMTEVETLMGESGMLVSSMTVNGRQTQTYKWSNNDYSRFIDVTVENGKVIEKKNKGLK